MDLTFQIVGTNAKKEASTTYFWHTVTFQTSTVHLQIQTWTAYICSICYLGQIIITDCQFLVPVLMNFIQWVTLEYFVIAFSQRIPCNSYTNGQARTPDTTIRMAKLEHLTQVCELFLCHHELLEAMTKLFILSAHGAMTFINNENPSNLLF